MADFTFWIVVGLTLGSAFMVVQSKNLLYSAYALLFSFIVVFLYGCNRIICIPLG